MFYFLLIKDITQVLKSRIFIIFLIIRNIEDMSQSLQYNVLFLYISKDLLDYEFYRLFEIYTFPKTCQITNSIDSLKA